MSRMSTTELLMLNTMIGELGMPLYEVREPLTRAGTIYEFKMGDDEVQEKLLSFGHRECKAYHRICEEAFSEHDGMTLCVELDMDEDDLPNEWTVDDACPVVVVGLHGGSVPHVVGLLQEFVTNLRKEILSI